ncbi:hypothetical protein Pint_24542 [Pistacia integerrima]|uniref:Uncharacterized protein n=1 Tax=Pistacia integerrima TaxID=434235 RepID=A0ACC0YA87_9ROSI|nr:hypothetical protein Pint_24542 [Pistacia integerrima]
MSQESFIYSFVARGTVILAEYTEFTGNFPAIAAQCLQRLPSSNNKFTYNCDHHTFNFLVEDGYAYCVVAKESVSKQISIAFLERMRADFKKRYGGGKADTAMAKSLNKEFGPIMKEHMKYIIDHAEEIEKLIKVKAQVSEVKSIMLENIDKDGGVLVEAITHTGVVKGGKPSTLKTPYHDSFIKLVFLNYFLVAHLYMDEAMERGENIQNLSDKTENLQKEAQVYREAGTRIRRKMWYQNMKIKLVVLGILLALVLIIWLSVCHGFNCTN